MSDAPIVYYDFEFGFTHGGMVSLTAQDGRDRIAADEARFQLEIHHSETEVEELIVHRDPRSLAYYRCTKRTVLPDPPDPPS